MASFKDDEEGWEDVDIGPKASTSDGWEDANSLELDPLARPEDTDPEAIATRLASEKYEEDKPGKLETMAHAAGKGIFRDWSDEIAARGAQAINAMRGANTDYDDLKMRTQARQDRAQRENPKTFGATEFAALMGTAPVTANPLLAGGVGVVEGGVSSLGRAKKLDAEAFKRAGIDAGISGVSSAAFTKAAPYLFKGLSKPFEGAYDKLRNVAGRQAVQAMKPTQKMVKDLQKKGIYEDVGKTALDKKIVTPLAKNSTMADRARQFTQESADQTRPIYSKAKDATMTKDDLLAMIATRQAALRPEPGKAPIVNKLSGYASDIESAAEAGRKTYNPSDLRNFRGDIDDTINFNSDSPTHLGGKEMRRLLRDQEMGLIEKVDPELRAQNEKLFKDIRYGNEIEKVAERGEAQNASNNAFGLTSYLAGGAMGTAGAALDLDPQTTAILGGIGLIGREGLRRYGNQMAATGLNNMAKLIASPKYSGLFQTALKRGGSMIPYVHSRLLEEDPEYRATYESAQE